MKNIHFYFISFGREERCRCTTHFRLMIPIHGKVSILTAGGWKQISGTQMCLLPFQEVYTTFSTVSNESLMIEIPEDFAAFYFKDARDKRVGITWAINAILQSVKELMLIEAGNNNSEGVGLLLNYLLQKMADQPTCTSIRFIHKHYTEKIEVKSLAAMEHYTPSYYCDWFKRKMNMTPLEYIHFLRIHRAKELLRESKLSVLTISYQLGYEYNASFTKMFKKYEQLSPTEYRAASNTQTQGAASLCRPCN